MCQNRYHIVINFRRGIPLLAYFGGSCKNILYMHQDNITTHKNRYENKIWCWKVSVLYCILSGMSNQTPFSHFWDRPVPIFSDVRFSYLALVQDKKITCVLPANACCTVYVNCPPNSPGFSFFKINNSLYISFQSFINTQILTISHIIT